MTISILTLFPDIFIPFCKSSIIRRAQEKKLVNIHLINLRDFATDKRKTVDDRPYSGGAGMILRVDILDKAIEYARNKFAAMTKSDNYTEKVILLDPTGTQFTQPKAKIFSEDSHLILICGHYEGIDARIEHFIDEKISVGKYILTGGEIPAMVITDAVIRLIPFVLAKKEATQYESFSSYHTYEPPQYTRPQNYKEYKVPNILLSGNHKSIWQWKMAKAKKR